MPDLIRGYLPELLKSGQQLKYLEKGGNLPIYWSCFYPAPLGLGSMM